MGVPAIDHHTTEYSLAHAYWLAKAAKLAYHDEAEIRAEVAQWGFDRCQFFQSKHVPPFPLDHTQAYMMASDHMIITAFRGTEPREIRDWLTDANTPVCPGPARKGLVHLGFYRALESVYQAITDKLREFRTNDQTLWFTGHSLGGALAMLAGARIYFEEPNLLPDGVYTFGQPRTCDRLLTRAHDSAFTRRFFRFVNNNDIVAHVPPEPVFTHVETLMYFDAKGKLHEKAPLLGRLKDKVVGMTTDIFAPASDGIRDHFIDNYLTVIEKNLR